MTRPGPLPRWFKQAIPDVSKARFLKKVLTAGCVHTVCEQARCPNIGCCWDKGVATIMILGDTCTRSCRFCAVNSGRPKEPDPQEPERVVQMIQELGLRYVVITSVTRDDLTDQGSQHFFRTICSIKQALPATKVEALIPDFFGEKQLIEKVIRSKAEVIAHNMETVERLSNVLRPQADYQRSLDVLRIAKQASGHRYLKSGFMVGLGETLKEIKGLMQDLISAGCDLLTIGQYLAPSKGKRHVAVNRFVIPEEFMHYQEMGRSLGFQHVFSGPLVRSSFLAHQSYDQCQEMLACQKTHS